MKIAIIGSRNLFIDFVELKKYLPEGITLIITGNTGNVSAAAERYADENNIPKLIILTEHQTHGYFAHFMRNKAIVNNADKVIAFWDGKSGGTKFAIDYAKNQEKDVTVHIMTSQYPDSAFFCLR